MQVPGDRLGKLGACGGPLLGLAYPRDELRVIARVGQALVGDEVRDPGGDKALQFRTGNAAHRVDDRAFGGGRLMSRRRRCQLGERGRERVRVSDVLPSPPEGLEVLPHLRPVELDRLLNGTRWQRERAGLECHPGQERVGELVAAEQRYRQLARIDENRVCRPRRFPDPRGYGAGVREPRGGVRHHGPGRDLRRGHHGDGAAGSGHGEVPGVGGDQEVTAKVEVALPCGCLVALPGGGRADLDVGDDRAALLGQPGLVEGPDLTAREHARSSKDLGERDHASAAHAGDPRRVRRGSRAGETGGLGKIAGPQSGGDSTAALPRPRVRHDRQKRRAVTGQAGVVLVAR